VLLAIGVVVLQASECSKEDFYDALADISLLTGSIGGRLTLDGDPVSGTTVTVRQGGSVIDTETTDEDGLYRIPGLNPGTYMASATIPGANCLEQTAVVEEGEETEVNIPCTTPEPQTGTVTGTVTVNGVGESGVAVTLREGSTVIGTTTTGTGGTYSFPNVATGTKTVAITPPDGATCETTQQDVTVPAEETATANFACTRPTSGDFTVGLGDLRWEHTMPGVESVECKVISTNPAQAGATWSATVNGPTEGGPSGVISGQTFGGTLDANGRAELRVRINLFGTYVNNVTVTLGSVTRNATASVTVASSANTCVAVTSSARFKRGVVALLPDEVRPLGLRPVAFRYREPWGDPAEPQIGLIAEGVVEVYPEAVFLDAEGRPQAIDYGRLTVSLIEEVEARAVEVVEAAIVRLADALE
jgi:hypothetical protein